MDLTRFVLVAGLVGLTTGQTGQGTGIWSDIVSCVRGLASTVDSSSNDPSNSFVHDFSTINLFSLICRDKDGFVHCLDNSLKQSNDSMAQIIGSLFDTTSVIHAYTGLCANISAIEKGGSTVLKCLSKATLLLCQSEVADYFFYMGFVRKFAVPEEQLSQKTMETLLCSVTAQRRSCEVQAIKGCSQQLGDIMEEFYRQTRPEVCTNSYERETTNAENNV